MRKGESIIPEIAREKHQKYLGGILKKIAFSNQINIVPTGHRTKDNLRQRPIILKTKTYREKKNKKKIRATPANSPAIILPNNNGTELGSLLSIF